MINRDGKDSEALEIWQNWIREDLKDIKGKLKAISDKQDIHNEEQTKIRIDLAKLKVKSSVWGMLGGGLTLLITIGVYLITKGGIP